MSKLVERISGHGGPWTATLMTAIAIAAIARGEEPKCELRVQGNLNHVALPGLSDLPLVGPLFKTVVCEGDCCADHLKCASGETVLPAPQPGRHLIIIKRLEGQPCAAECEVETKCGSDHCCECETLKATLAARHAAGHPADAKPSWEEIVELASQKAALEAAVEAHEAIAEAKEAMFESLSELIAEKAALEAKVEFQAERDELNKHVQELAAENARLKAQSELASVRLETLQQTMHIAAENEHLKLRLAELERHFDSDAAARTAKRNQTGKKTR